MDEGLAKLSTLERKQSRTSESMGVVAALSKYIMYNYPFVTIQYSVFNIQYSLIFKNLLNNED